MEYYSVLKRNELSSHEKTWRNLKRGLLSEGSQSEKAALFMIPSILQSSGKGNTEMVRRSVVVAGVRRERGEEVEHRASEPLYMIL